ncbi:flagellar motor switch protein FliG [Parasphingorhabdus cellanae]|uniref:Flagellar motor switch protein FliG n=1 Tax=Parasphingorhabdus cellanae TaxID=2806553 RepID=A0ABX7T4G7_9SPHN|nr:flagellar motor switch protein FliG [Parasphingorhabdus cellanae]QTD56481.1 flagellar motor switch protein FliG [Parasphingorhabdus cellanae]
MVEPAIENTALVNDLSAIETTDNPIWSGHEIAAILLMTFGEDEAADILSRLKPVEVQSLGSAMLAITKVGEEDVNFVFDRFVEQARSRTAIGYRAHQQITSIMGKAFGPGRAANMLTRIAPHQSRSDLNHLYRQLDWMSAEEIASMIADEHPQMMAVILSFLEPEIAGDVLQQLGEDIQDDVVFRVADMGPIGANAIADIEALITRQSEQPAITISQQSGGTSEAAAIMNNVAKQTEQRIIKALLKRDKVLARKIEDDMFVFGDLMDLDDKSLGAVLRLIENAVLILAIKGADPDLAGKMFGCMSKRAAQSIEDEIADMGPVSKDEVSAAQKQVVAQAKALAEDGTIILGGQNDEFV